MDGMQKNANVSKEMKLLWGSKTIGNEYGMLGEMHREMEKAGIKCEKKDKSGNQPDEIWEYNYKKQYDESMYRKLSAVYSVLNQIKKKGTVVTADMITEDTYKTVKEKYGISTKDLKRLVNDAQQGRVPDFSITDSDIEDKKIDTAEEFVIKGPEGDKRDLTEKEKEQRLRKLINDRYEALKKEAEKELEAAKSERVEKELEVAKLELAAKEKELEAASTNKEQKQEELETAKLELAAKEKELEAAKLKEEAKQKEFDESYSDGEMATLSKSLEGADFPYLKKNAEELFKDDKDKKWEKTIFEKTAVTRNSVTVKMNNKIKRVAEISSGKFTKTLYYKVIQGSNQNMRKAVTSLKELLEEKRKTEGERIKSFQMITLSEGEIQEFGSRYGISKKDLLKLSTEIQSGKTSALEEALTIRAGNMWRKLINRYKEEERLEEWLKEAKKLLNGAETDVEKAFYSTRIEELEKEIAECKTLTNQNKEEAKRRMEDAEEWKKNASPEDKELAETHYKKVRELYTGQKIRQRKKSDGGQEKEDLKTKPQVDKPIIPGNLDGQVLAAHYTVDSTKRWLFEQKIKKSLRNIPGKLKMVSISQLVTSLNEEMKYEDEKKENQLKAYCMSLSHEEKIRKDINGLAAVLRILHARAVGSGLDSQTDLGGGLVLFQVAALVEALGKIYSDGAGNTFFLPGYRKLGEDKKWSWIPERIEVGAIDIIREAMTHLELLLEDTGESYKDEIDLEEFTENVSVEFQNINEIKEIKGTLRLSDIKKWCQDSASDEKIKAMKQELDLVKEVHDDVMKFINKTPELKDLRNKHNNKKEERIFRDIGEVSRVDLLKIYPVFHQVYQKANAIHSRAGSFQKSFTFQQLAANDKTEFKERQERMLQICTYFQEDMRKKLNYEYKAASEN